MSPGVSAGDLIAAGNLIYQLIKALRGSHDAGEEYRAAIHELGCMQNAFMRVSCLRANSDVSQATFDSATCIIMGSMGIIKTFLDKTKKYDRRLGLVGSSGLAVNMRKIGWTLFKAEDMKKLRDSLQSSLSSLSLLLMAANLEPDGAGKVSTFLEVEVQHVPAHSDDVPYSIVPRQSGTNETLPTTLGSGSVSTRTSESMESVIDGMEVSPDMYAPPANASAEAQHEQMSLCASSKPFGLSSFSFTQLQSLILDHNVRSAKIKEVSGLVRTLILLGEYQLYSKDHTEFIRLLDQICGQRKMINRLDENLGEPVRFKDAVGRKFSFPWELCKTWKGMEELIKQAFLHVEIIGPHVHQGHYDLVGPDGEIILPQVWDTMIQPGWAITMHMWPMPNPPKADEKVPRRSVPDSIPSPLPPPLRRTRSNPDITSDKQGG